jgi:hypothetical protein
MTTLHINPKLNACLKTVVFSLQNTTTTAAAAAAAYKKYQVLFILLGPSFLLHLSKI